MLPAEYFFTITFLVPPNREHWLPFPLDLPLHAQIILDIEINLLLVQSSSDQRGALHAPLYLTYPTASCVQNASVLDSSSSACIPHYSNLCQVRDRQRCVRVWLFCLQSMAWLGQKLVLCTSLRYVLLHPAQGTSTQLFALAEEAPSPTLVQSIPAANLAVLLMVCSP